MKCEIFLEELSSAPDSISPELKQHLLVCPDCKAIFDGINEMQALRAPVSAKELASIKKIKDSIKSSSPGTSSTTTVSGIGFYGAVIALCAVLGVAGLYIENKSPVQNLDEQTVSLSPKVESFKEIVLTKNDFVLRPNSDSQIDCFAPGNYRANTNGVVVNSGKSVIKISNLENGFNLFTPLFQANLKDCWLECKVDKNNIYIKVIKGRLKLTKNDDNKAVYLTAGQNWKGSISSETSAKAKTLVVSPIKEDLELRNEDKK